MAFQRTKRTAPDIHKEPQSSPSKCCDDPLPDTHLHVPPSVELRCCLSGRGDRRKSGRDPTHVLNEPLGRAQ